ncbi:DsrE family protein [Cognataquiflexum rubidum]|uniref:DsrE family protein n=1 Tax=Cognataquiflexum rubidum TaxID=2922273 RepID=UPI001F12E3C0|nr:DsrE family protein [Cognataquiflexum rubidum]MCH6235053.1 DsrE family protein [Cognataquiflexum rubidum]
MESNITLKIILLVVIVAFSLEAIAQTETTKEEKVKVLIHITHGPENPTRATLGFLVAKTAIEEGYSVTLFLAGDAVQLLRSDVLDNLVGLGTGNLRAHYDAILKGGGKFYLSGMSAKSRGLTEADLSDKTAEFAMPKVLLQLSMESDRMFVY